MEFYIYNFPLLYILSKDFIIVIKKIISYYNLNKKINMKIRKILLLIKALHLEVFIGPDHPFWPMAWHDTVAGWAKTAQKERVVQGLKKQPTRPVVSARQRKTCLAGGRTGKRAYHT